MAERIKPEPVLARFERSLENMAINEVKAREEHVVRVLNQRRALIYKVGFGTVDLAEDKNIDRVGKVRAGVENSVEVLRQKAKLLEREIHADNNVFVYMDAYKQKLMKAKQDLAEYSSRHFKGEITRDELEAAKAAYDSKCESMVVDPAMQRAYERKRREERIRQANKRVTRTRRGNANR